MVKFTLPMWINEHNFSYTNINEIPKDKIDKLRNRLKKFNVRNPEVSIVIPAYNEEKNILRLLSSLSKIKTKYATEIIVCNNNSKDRTQEILDLLEVKSVFVKNQGISYARQAGLEMSKGTYILNADADTLYPPSWGDLFIETLKNREISCVYGSYSFIPSESTSRIFLAAYELIARSFFALKRKNRECVNVMGFNFAFRKEDAMAIGGFNHHLQRNITARSEDGWMALKLTERGSTRFIRDKKLTVWTSDRRLMEDGGLGKAFIKRFKKEITRLGIYFKALPTVNK